MLNAIKTFSADETGAVTVDWVVLTAALVGLGLAVMGVVSDGVSNLTGDIGNQLCGNVIDTNFNPGTSAGTLTNGNCQ